MPNSHISSHHSNLEKLEQTVCELRETVIQMLLEAGSGHSAGSLSAAEIMTALYFNVLNIDPKNPTKEDRDRFVISNGHVCPIWYATLSARGYFPKKELWTLRKFGSPLQGHPIRGLVPGVDNTSGSLAQGFSQAVGMALASKMDQKTHRIYVLTGDGELDEGQTWEAAMFAANHHLTNLTWLIDRNGIQIDGFTEEVAPLEDLRSKLEAFNWYVLEVDGHNIEELINACNMAKTISQRPTVIIAHTIPGKGVKFMENKVEWHGKTPNSKEARQALNDLHSLEGKLLSDYD